MKNKGPHTNELLSCDDRKSTQTLIEQVLFTFTVDAAQLKIDECNSEMIRLRGVTTALDKERDALQQQLDLKTEDAVRLNRDLSEKVIEF